MKKRDLEIRRGATFVLPVVWESTRLIYRAISNIDNSAPVRITASAHGIPDGWPVAVMNVKGLTELNAQGQPPADCDFHTATVSDPNTVELNRINGAGFRPYVAGGQLVFYEPALPDSPGTQVRLQVRARPGGVVLQEFTLGNGITLDPGRKRIVLDFHASTFVTATWRSGVYDLEVEDTSWVVTPLLYGSVKLLDEITA